LLPPTLDPPDPAPHVADVPRSALADLGSLSDSPQTGNQVVTPQAPSKQIRSTTTLFQQIDVQRAPKLSILGAVSVQDLRYQVLSELRLDEPDVQNVRSVHQLILDTRLVKSDDLSRAMYEESLRELKGWQFTYKLNGRGDVVEWINGPAHGRKAAPVEPKGAQGFLVTSVMDEDGWKEMAQLSFFVPDEPATGNQARSRPMNHDFGPLGTWYGQTRFVRKPSENGLLCVDYVHHMTYKPPDKNRGDLPFAIKDAMFEPEVAGGTIYFDTQVGRVQTAKERFVVKGKFSTEIFGQVSVVQVEEQQAIIIRIFEQNPWGQN
jgi:hypothetical protein